MTVSSILLLVIALLIWGALPASANDFKNPDFKSGLSSWSFDGEGKLIYLLPNQTEGKKEDPGAYPVVKLLLSATKAVVIFQDIDRVDDSPMLHLRIDVLPSKDFKRINMKDTKMGWEIGIEMPVEDGGPFDADFWIRGPRWALKLISLQLGVWNHVEANFRVDKGLKKAHIEFNAPPGVGAIYLTSPSATSK